MKTFLLPLSRLPWSLATSLESSLLRKVEDVGEPLPAFVDLAITGVKTGANKVFAFEAPIALVDSTVHARPEGEDTVVDLEADLLRP